MRIAVYLDALTGGFETDIERARKVSEKAFKQIRKDMETVAKVATGTFAAGITAATLIVRKNLEDINDLNVFSKKIGIAIEDLSALSYAANLLDVSMESLQGGFFALTKAQTAAATGSDEMKALFHDLGIEFEDAPGKLRDAGEVFDDIADLFAEMPDGAQKTALALKLLGGAGADLIPLLNQGADGIERFKDEARELGLTTSGETAEAAEELNKNIKRLQTTFGNAGVTFTTTLLPALEEISEQVVDMAHDPAFQQDLANAIVTIAEASIGAVEHIVEFINVLKFLYDEAKQLIGLVDDNDIVRLQEQADLERENIKKLRGQEMILPRIGESEPGGFAAPITLHVDDSMVKEAEDRLAELEGKIDAFNARQEHQLQKDRAKEITKQFRETSAELNALLSPASGFAFRDTKGEKKARAEAEKAAKELAKLRLESLSEEEKSVEELRQKYDQLDKLLAKNAVSVEDAAKIRTGLAAAKVEPLRQSALTDEQRAVDELNKHYKELENLVKVGAIERGEANKIAAAWAQQWAESQSRQIQGWRVAAGELTLYEQGLADLNEQFKEMQRNVDAGGPGALSQEMADKLKQEMTDRFKAAHAVEFDDKMDSIELSLPQLGAGDLGTLEEDLAHRKAVIEDSYENTARDLQQMLKDYGEQEIEERNRINAAIELNQKAHDQAMKKVEKDAQIEKLDILSDAFGGFAALMNTHNQKLFNIGKAFAIAQAVTSVASGAAKALELGWPLGPIAAAAVATEGAVRIATILSTEYSGSYDTGGEIPKGKWGIVGERGPEIVHGPATVISRKETEIMMRDAENERKRNEIELRRVNSMNNRYVGMFDAGGFLPLGTWGYAGEKGRELVSNAQVSSQSAPQFERMTDREINIPPTKNVFVFDIDQLADALASSQAGERMVVHHVTRTGSKQRG